MAKIVAVGLPHSIDVNFPYDPGWWLYSYHLDQWVFSFLQPTTPVIGQWMAGYIPPDEWAPWEFWTGPQPPGNIIPW